MYTSHQDDTRKNLSSLTLKLIKMYVHHVPLRQSVEEMRLGNQRSKKRWVTTRVNDVLSLRCQGLTSVVRLTLKVIKMYVHHVPLRQSVEEMRLGKQWSKKRWVTTRTNDVLSLSCQGLKSVVRRVGSDV